MSVARMVISCDGDPYMSAPLTIDAIRRHDTVKNHDYVIVCLKRGNSYFELSPTEMRALMFLMTREDT